MLGRPQTAFWLTALAAAAFSGLSCGDEPSIEILQQALSPDGSKVATAFSCEGGGAAGYAFTNVTLRQAGEALDPFDGLLGKHKSWRSFHDIQVHWADNENLEISYRAWSTSGVNAEQLATRVLTRDGVDIHYDFKD